MNAGRKVQAWFRRAGGTWLETVMRRSGLPLLAEDEVTP
jgi:hypothetical protein